MRGWAEAAERRAEGDGRRRGNEGGVMGVKLTLHEGELCRAKREIQRREPVKASRRIRQGDDANSVRNWKGTIRN